MVETNASEDFGIGTTREDDTALEEAEPGCCERTKDCCSREYVLARFVSQHNVSTKMVRWSKGCE